MSSVGTAETNDRNVYEFRNQPLADPKARERVVWIIFGGGGLLMSAIGAFIALSKDDGLTQGLIFVGLGLLIAILPFGLRQGIRSQNARREGFRVEITADGVLKISSIENVAGRTEAPKLEPKIDEFPLRDATEIRFVKDVLGGDFGGAHRSREEFYYIAVVDRAGEERRVPLPPNAMGQRTGLPVEEQARLKAAAQPFLSPS